MNMRGPYRNGALFLLISAILHLIAPIVSGFSGDGLMLAAVGVFYLVATWGLLRGMRWLAYVMFIVLMVGSIAALTGIWALGPVPGWVYAGIVIANWIAVVMLFIALWRPAPKTAF